MSRERYRPFTMNLRRTGKHPSGFQGFRIGLQKAIEEQRALRVSTRATGRKDSVGTAAPNFAKHRGRISRAG